MNKKVEVITKYFHPVSAGIETNTLETYSVMAKKGWDVTIHTSADTYLEKNSLPKNESLRGLKIKRYPFNSEILGYMPEIDWDKTDAVCLHNFNMSHFRILVKALYLKLIGKKHFALIVTPHGGFNPEWSIFDFKTRLIKKSYQYILGTLMVDLVADGVRAVSEWERKEMIKKGILKNKIRLITNGLEDEAYMDVDKLASKAIKKTVKDLGNYIIQVGRVYPIKNYETTIKALVNTPKNLKYVIVGPIQVDEKNKNYKEELDKLIKELGLSNRVFFLGVIKGVDKYYIVKHAKAMVHMAVWESFCNVVHEALSQGLICIVANNTALPLLIKNGINGYTVETKNSIKLAEKINYVLSNYNTSKLKKIRNANMKIGAESSWTFVADKMDKFYTELINKVQKK